MARWQRDIIRFGPRRDRSDDAGARARAAKLCAHFRCRCRVHKCFHFRLLCACACAAGRTICHSKWGHIYINAAVQHPPTACSLHTQICYVPPLWLRVLHKRQSPKTCIFSSQHLKSNDTIIGALAALGQSTARGGPCLRLRCGVSKRNEFSYPYDLCSACGYVL